MNCNINDWEMAPSFEPCRPLGNSQSGLPFGRDKDDTSKVDWLSFRTDIDYDSRGWLVGGRIKAFSSVDFKELPVLNLDELGHHIRCHLEEDPDGIGAHLAELRAVDVADILNRLTDAEAARVIALIPAKAGIEAFNQNLLRRRSRILDQLDPKRACARFPSVSAARRTRANAV